MTPVRRTSVFAWAAVALLSPAAPSDAATRASRVNVINQFGGATVAVTTVADRAYIGVGPRMVILDVTSPTGLRVIGESEPLPGVVLSIAVSGRYAYVGAGDAGLRVVDLQDEAHPVEVGAFEGPDYATSVMIRGQFAYVADGDHGLVVVDISNPLQPSAVVTADTPGTALRVLVHDNVAYVCDRDEGVRILDLTDPALPIQVGQHNTPGYAQDAALSGSMLFVADGFAGLRVLDVSNPATPVAVGALDTGGDSKSVAVVGPIAFLADGANGLRIVDVSNPASPVEVGAFETSGDTPANTSAVTASGAIVYVADGDVGFKVLDVTNPEQPLLTDSYEVPGFVQDVAVKGPLALLANDTQGLWVIDPGVLPATTVATLDTPGGNIGVVLDGDRAYLADGYAGIRIVDVTDPAAPTEVGAFDTQGFAWDVAIRNELAFVADGDYGLVVIDVADATAPRMLSVTLMPQPAIAVTLDGGLAYVATLDSGVRIIDVSNPLAPIEIGVADTPGAALQVAVAGDHLYIADGPGGVRIVDVSTPTAPAERGSSQLHGSYAFAVTVANGYAYVTSGNAGLSILDVANPARPREVGFFDSPGTAWRVTLHQDVVYLSDESGGLFLLTFAPGPVLGGDPLGIAAGDSAPALDWAEGLAQHRYLVVRYAIGAGTTESTQLPGSATGYVDGSPLSDPLHFYWLVNLDEGNVAIGSTSLVGLVPNTSFGPAVPDDFHLEINRLGAVNLTWTPDNDPSAVLLVAAIPLDGAAPRLTVVAATDSSAVDTTSGIPTCYSLLQFSGYSISRTTFLCAIPR